MRKTKTYQNNSPLENGFLLSEHHESSLSLVDICSRASSSITLVDTEDYILNSFLDDCINILNGKSVVVAAVVSKKTLATLKGKGVLTGFFRATDEKLPLGLLILDKKEVWACFGNRQVCRVSAGSEELFQYANHLLWAKTDNEYSFGESRRVQQTMLSVVMPFPKVGIVPGGKHEYASVGLTNEKGLLVNEFGEYDRPAIVMPLDCKAYMDQNRLFVEIIPDAFYELIGGSSLKIGESLDPTKATPKDLIGKDIFYKGHKQTVVDAETLTETIYVPVGEVANYQPDFDAIYARRAQVSAETNVVVDVVPMKRDNSYQLSSNYAVKKRIDEQINDALGRLQKLNLDKAIEKKVQSVGSERIFEEKVRLYNDLINSLDYGVDALKNQKNSFKSINQSKESFIVPHEMVGTLLSKGKGLFLAISSEAKANDAKAWLRENRLEATLILDSKE